MKLTLVLSHLPKQGPNPGGYIVPPLDPPYQRVVVDSYGSAVDAMRRFVDRNLLGAGNMAKDCGHLIDESGSTVGRIAYNGSIFDKHGRQTHNPYSHV